MKNRSEAYGKDIFGNGNGTLSIAIMPTPEEWEVGRGLHVCLTDEDLEAISLEAFRIATNTVYRGEADIMKLRKDDRRWFAGVAPEFPMLSRINYIFEDVFFDPQEVERLKEECLGIRSSITNAAADLGLRKLLYSCDEALDDKFGLELTCD